MVKLNHNIFQGVIWLKNLKKLLSLVVCMVMVFSAIPTLNLVASAETSNYVLNLKGGPGYTFTGEQWDPQLVIEAVASMQTSDEIEKIKFDIAIPQYDDVMGCFRFGSRVTAGGGSFGYGGNDLALYFTGSNDVFGIGVTQIDFKSALEANAEALRAGETVTLEFVLSGGNFTDTGYIDGINIMISHYSKASSLDGKDISISDIEFVLSTDDYVPDDNELVLTDGPDFTYGITSFWDPQICSETRNFVLPKDTKYMQLLMDIDNITKVLDEFSFGSTHTLGVGEATLTYFKDEALGIFFDGNNVNGIGVTQEDLKNSLIKNKDLFGKGEMVLVEVPLKAGESGIADNAVIKEFNWLTDYLDVGEETYNDINFNIQKVTFTAEAVLDSTLEEPEVNNDPVYYTYTVTDGEATITGCDTSVSGEVIIPSTLGGFTVTAIGDSAFHNCTLITSITVPDTVTSIGAYAFSMYSKLYYDDEMDYIWVLAEIENSLVNITLSDNLISIGDFAFAGCNELESITIPDSVANIGEFIFHECYNLTYLKIPFIGEDLDAPSSLFYLDNTYSWGSVLPSLDELIITKATSIGDWAFANCESLTSITIPDSVTSIGERAFKGCFSLEKINIPDSVTSVGAYAFEGCSSLTSVKLGEGVTSISEGMFYNCSSLTSITIGKNIKSISADAFFGCYSLKGVNVTDIGAWSEVKFDNVGANPLFYAEKLYIKGKPAVEVVIPNGTKAINDYAFINCSTIKTVSIPETVTAIGKSAFEYCVSLEHVEIAEGVTEIADYAFYNCYALESITVPKTVKNIEDEVFFDCYSLADVYFGGTENEWNEITIGNYNDDLMNATLHFEEAQAIVGDIDNNGSVDILDIIIVKNTLLNNEVSLYAAKFDLYDINGDGCFNALDLIVLRKILFENF